PWDARRLLALFQEWGFRGFAEQVRKLAMEEGISLVPEKKPTGKPPSSASVQNELFLFAAEANSELEDSSSISRNGQGATDGWQGVYHLVDTEEKLQDFLKEFRKQKRFAFDLETTELQPLEADIVGWAICWKAGEAWYLAIRGPEGSPTLDPLTTL